MTTFSKVQTKTQEKGNLSTTKSPNQNREEKEEADDLNEDKNEGEISSPIRSRTEEDNGPQSPVGSGNSFR